MICHITDDEHTVLLSSDIAACTCMHQALPCLLGASSCSNYWWSVKCIYDPLITRRNMECGNTFDKQLVCVTAHCCMHTVCSLWHKCSSWWCIRLFVKACMRVSKHAKYNYIDNTVYVCPGDTANALPRRQLTVTVWQARGLSTRPLHAYHSGRVNGCVKSKQSMYGFFFNIQRFFWRMWQHILSFCNRLVCQLPYITICMYIYIYYLVLQCVIHCKWLQ
jgi:hypothetical protein